MASGVVLLAAAPAGAQNIQHFEPAAGATGGLLIEAPLTPGHLRLQESFTVNYGREPLVFVSSAGEDVVVVQSLTTLDPLLTIGLGDRFLLGLDIPLHHVTGEGAEASGEDGFHLGDVRIVDRVRLLDLEPVTLGFALPITLPTGADKAYVGDGSLAFHPKLLATLDLGAADVMLNLGGRIHTGEEKIAETTIGNTFTYGAGVGVDVANIRLTGEAFGAVPFEDASSKKTANPLEALLGGRWAFSPEVSLDLGVGFGIVGDAGTPAFRALIGMVFEQALEAGPEPEATIAETPPPDAEAVHAAESEAAVAAAPVAPSEEAEPSYAALGETEAEAAAKARPAQAAPPAPPVAHAEPPAKPKPHAEPAAEPEAAEPEEEAAEEPPPPPKKKPRGKGPSAETLAAKLNAAASAPAKPGKKGGHKKRPSVYFGDRVRALDARAKKELDAVVSALEEAPDTVGVRLTGHSDDSHGSDDAMADAKARALAAKKYLISKGIDADRIETEWHGDEEPIGKNKTEAGRSVNRRVDYLYIAVE